MSEKDFKEQKEIKEQEKLKEQEKERKEPDVTTNCSDKCVNMNNNIRNLGLFIYDKCDFRPEYLLGSYYYVIHLIIIFFNAFVTMFSTNLFHLSIVLLIVSMDAWSVVILHGCPLTLLEKKYLNVTSCEQRKFCFDILGLLHNCEHYYENVLELLVNVWSAVAMKLLIIIFLSCFKIKLFDCAGIYG